MVEGVVAAKLKELEERILALEESAKTAVHAFLGASTALAPDPAPGPIKIPPEP